MAVKRGALPAEGLKRVIIEGVRPQVDCGEFPAKGTRGEDIEVEADVFTDGHDAICAFLLHRYESERKWHEVPMEALPNDRWRASFPAERLGIHVFTIAAAIAHFKTWRRDLKKRLAAGQDLEVDLRIGAELLEQAGTRARAREAKQWGDLARMLRADTPQEQRALAILAPELDDLECTVLDRTNMTFYQRELQVWVDRERAGFSTWYELFPRSARGDGTHGTFADVEKLVPYVAGMGFDVLYLPPIHPIGMQFRKGRNNTLTPEDTDVGSPWAIGGAEGGHKAIHPQLGTLDDFKSLLRTAQKYGVELALDIAFQASPDHPYVREHEAWFRKRPDGTIQYAENPPKKYQDIYPFDFESAEWQTLWRELKSVFDYWIEQGVRIFRVDNPHTKAFPFWAWCIPEIRRENPDVLFLSEAFTRPRVMYRLAKLGFTQSYTYFAWRTHKRELIEYFTELTRTEVADFFRPNLWPNTPDILTEQLQTGGRPTFMARLVLAATLGASYGIYGPAFELQEHVPRESGSEEYLHSEKYEIRKWQLDAPHSLHDFIQRVNRLRHENRALQTNRTLRFHTIENDNIIAYSKTSDDPSSLILTIVNLDPANTHSGWVHLPLRELGISETKPYEVHDRLSDARYTWSGEWNYVELDPHVVPAHIFSIERVPPRRETTSA